MGGGWPVGANGGVARLAEDHTNAAALAEALAVVPGLRVLRPPVPTNMVWIELEAGCSAATFTQQLTAFGFRALARPPQRVRFVLHRGVPAEAVNQVAAAVRQLLGEA